MNLQIGFIFKIKNNYISIVVPSHFSLRKYKKIQLNIKKYNIAGFKKEYFLGDFILFNRKNNKIYNLF